MQPTSKIPALFLAAALCAPLPAQRPGQPAIAAALQGVGLASDGDHLCGAGPDYEVRFDRHGVEYLPMLGRKAPRHLPLRFTFESVRRGSAVLGAGGEVSPAHDGTTVRYERGSVTERYDLRRDGVEQSFVFASRPGGTGDLVVRGRIATDLPPSLDAEIGIDFVMPGIGGVRYGKVTGVDALGRTAPGTISVSGNVIELALPAAFVDTARYPMVLDPLLGTALQVAFGTSNDDGEPDVAYDFSNDLYLVVWKRSASTAGTGIRAQRVAADGTLAGALILVSGSGAAGGQLLPRVANVNQRDRFLVVWQDSPSIFGPFDIVCRSVAAVDGALSAIVPVAATAADETAACCSGDATTNDDEALVVWHDDDAGILAAAVTLPVTGDPVLGAPVVITATARATAPCISKSGGAAGRHLIAWQELDASPLQVDIHARAVTRNLALIGSELVVGSTVNDTLPAVDGSGDAFTIVWTKEPGDIVGQMVSATNAALTVLGAQFVVENDAADNETNADVVYLGGDKWCVVWNELRADFGSDAFGAILSANGSRCGLELTFPGMDRTALHTRESLPRIVGKHTGSFDAGSDEGMVVFGEAQHLPPFESDVVAQRVEAIGQGGTVTTVSPSCGLGGTASVNGPFAVGNPNFQFTLAGADPLAPLCFLSLGFPSPPIPCGSCSFSQGIAINFVPITAGNATSAFPTSCDPIYIGLQIEFQWWTFLGTSSPCPAAPGLTGSNRVVVTLGP